MRLTATVIHQFEQDQVSYGTATALFNLLWLKAADDLSALGVTRVKTSTTPRKGVRRARRRRTTA